MNGKRFVFDTNAVIALLKGNETLQTRCQHAQWLAVSVITALELLSFNRLTNKDIKAIQSFLSRVEVIGLDHSDQTMINLITDCRKNTGMKLPDSIIAATAVYHQVPLYSNDKQLLKCQFRGLQVIEF